MRILLTGATGMLGSAMVPILKERGHTVIPTNHIVPHCDVRSIPDLQKAFDRSNPEIVFHLAAMTDVDRCELEPYTAFKINGWGTENVATLCHKNHIPMLYVSTIGVFGGQKTEPYTELDGPNPANYYGLSKWVGEIAVKTILKQYYIVRAGWMMGGGPSLDKKFIGKIISQLKANHTIKAVDDKIGSPTYVVDFSHTVANLIESGKYGLYHCTNKGRATRFDVAKFIVNVMGTDNEVLPAKSTEFPLPAPRADSEMSINYNLEKIGINTMRNWDTALRDYLDKYWK